MTAVHIEDLIGAQVEDADGRTLGRVVDLQVSPNDGWLIVGIVLGRHAVLDRLDLLRAVFYRMGNEGESRVIPWAEVVSCEGRRIRLRTAEGSGPTTGRSTGATS